MRSLHLDRLRRTRVLLPLTTAFAVAVPAVWWTVGSSTGDDDRALASKPHGAALVTPTGEGRDRLDDGPSALGSGQRDADSRPLRHALESRSLDPLAGPDGDSAGDLGVLLRGNLHCSNPSVTGAVLIRALGPEGRVVDELGILGGAYSIHGLSPGDWRITLRGPSILDREVALRVEAEREEIELDLTVDTAVAVPVVFVTSWGERLESALAEAERDAAGMPLVEVLGAEIDSPAPDVLPSMRAGRFRSASLAADGSLPAVSGWIELHSLPPVEVRLVQAGAELERRRISDSTETLMFVVDPLEESGRPVLTGLLVDASTGDPIDDAIVELFGSGGEAPVRTRRVGPGGTLQMAGIGEGDWVLSVWSAGRAHLLHTFRIGADSDYALGALELHAARAVGGRLLAPDGRALANRSLRWISGRRPARVALGYGREAVRTDAGGMFAIGGVADGSLTVIAGGDEFAAGAFEFVVTRERPQEFDIQLERGVPVEIAIGGEIEAPLELLLRNGEGRVVFLRPARTGRAVRAVLAPGAYDVELFDGARLAATERFHVGDTPLEVLLEAAGG